MPTEISGENRSCPKCGLYTSPAEVAAYRGLCENCWSGGQPAKAKSTSTPKWIKNPRGYIAFTTIGSKGGEG